MANNSQPDYPNDCAQKQKRTPLITEYLSKKRKKNCIQKERKQLEIDLQNHGKFQNEFAKFQTAKDLVKHMRKRVKSKLSSYQSRLKNKRFVTAVMKKDPQRYAQMFDCNCGVKEEATAKRRKKFETESGNVVNDFILDEKSGNLLPRSFKCHGIEKANACTQVNIDDLTLKKVCNVSIQCKTHDYHRKLGASSLRLVDGNTTEKAMHTHPSNRDKIGGKENTELSAGDRIAINTHQSNSQANTEHTNNPPITSNTDQRHGKENKAHTNNQPLPSNTDRSDGKENKPPLNIRKHFQVIQIKAM